MKERERERERETMAADSAAIKSTFFHPQHLLTRYHYTDASTHSCAACELTVTGAGYSCDECGFNIHEACLSLPLLVDFDGHPGHHLTLTRLGASRWCDACRETSGAGRYMYLCAACNYDVHPRCTSLVAAQQGERRRRRRGKTRTVIKVGVIGFRVVDLLTGGFMSPVLDIIDAAVGN